jgi:LysM repeat protein
VEAKKMKRIHPSLSLSAVCLLTLLSLVTGCYRQAAPDVTPTPAGGAAAVQPEEGAPDLEATAIANATLAAQVTEETPAAETPIVPTSTATATPIPTTVLTTPVPTTLALASPVPTLTSPPTGRVTHTVQRGENLFRIALRYGTTVQAVASANGITNPALIYVGQVLTIPSPGSQPSPPTTGGTTYVVQRGDNLFRIALRYNMSYVHLAQYNGIANPAHIYVGQVLRIPPY